MLLRDRPGALAAAHRARGRARAPTCSQIEHDRAFSRAPLGESEVELTLETSGPEQIEAIKRHLTEAGYVAEEVSPA